MTTNGLEFKTLATTSKPVIIQNDGDIINNAPENAWFVAYLDHRVVIGRLIDETWSYYQQSENDVILRNIQKLRVFNKDAELLVWRTRLGGYNARLKTDCPGEGQKVVDATQVMFGTEAEMIDGSYMKLTEKRGTEIVLPGKDLGISAAEVNDRKGRLCIHTRSYIGVIATTGQATYNDVRFVEFVKYQEEAK
ncbi:MAG: CRISPR-associated protein Csx19 [Mariniphaga sp.]